MWQLLTLVFCVLVYLLATNNNKPPDIYNVQECDINVLKNSPYNPLVLQFQPNGFQYQFPNQNQIKLKNNNEIYIGCPTGKLQTPTRFLSEGPFTCLTKSTFISSTERTKIDFHDISCKSPVEVNSIRSHTLGNSCLEGYDEHGVGYSVMKQFIPVYTVCRNEKSSVRVYSKSVLNHGEFSRENSTKFVNNDGFYKVSEPVLDRIYTFSEQTKILGGYTTIDEQKYWDKGQLTPSYNFRHRFQQEATYHYNNVFPQWKKNVAIWNNLEENLRKNITEDASVFTGTFGVVQINRTKFELPVNPGEAIPVPKFVWKNVYVKGEAISNYVYFVENSPEATSVGEICSKVTTGGGILEGQVGITVCEKQYIVDDELRHVLMKLN